MMGLELADNIAAVRRNIADAALAAGRDPGAIRLVAVSKGVDAATIQRAAGLGLTDFGENRVQEGRTKRPVIQEAVTWHFIGHLQSNKVKYVLGQYAMLHSLDRMSLARELSKRLERQRLELDCLVQVNVAREAVKHGLEPDRALPFVDAVRRLPGICVVGLMTIPPFSEDAEASRPHYRGLRLLAHEIAARQWPGVGMDQLSMGMSGDYPVAIAEGATMVRVGSALFRGDDR